MTDEIRKPVRIGARISADTHDWLEKKSYELGISKSALIVFALETYKTQDMTVMSMPGMLKHLDDDKS